MGYVNWWTATLTIVLFIFGLAVAVLPIVLMPPDALIRRDQRWRDSRSPWRWTVLVLKNLLGLVVVSAGALMLVLPGQGILTILVGVMLLDFPGKRALLRKMLKRPGVQKAINRLRARFGKPPLVNKVPDEDLDKKAPSA